MGAGAVAGLSAATSACTEQDLQAALKAIPSDQRAKLLAAMGGANGATPASRGAAVSAEVLAKQNSETSQAILTCYADDLLFQSISDRLTKEIMQRDKEDGDKLGSGIQKAVDKGVLPANVDVEPTKKVGVSGKTADAVAGEIISALGDAPSKGCVLVLQGLSGTGKGTTVAKLKEKLPNAQTWSNGNIFRAITLLAVTWSEQEGKTLEEALAPDKLKDFCAMLEFNKFGDSTAFDVKIEGLGMKHFVSEVEKTVLKDSKVAKNIPTIAEVTQGECVMFVSDALAKMAAAGINVLVEGREQTLNHLRTPHRFELVLDDNSIIGKRQAALQVGGKAWEQVKSATADQATCDAAIKAALADLGKVTADTLSKQNSETSQAILSAYSEDPLFQKIADRLTKEIMQRDQEDGDKLGKGIAAAVTKGVLPASIEVEPTKKVGVSGKSADAVADEIIAALGDAPSKGCVLILQGLSGTGKGTTVAKLKEKLPKAQTWSNGNIFRSITLLAVTWSEKEGKTIQDAMTPEKLKEFCAMLEFNKFGDSTMFDVKIEGLDMKHFVSEVEKTVLKDSKVATNIPTIAEVTQGECILFVSDALAKMSAAGINVLVEGREQTLNHIRSPHRFELVLDDNSIIGKRQAALQIGGKAWAEVKEAKADQAAVDTAIKNAIVALAA
jgi:cytidylate kinase